MVNYSRLGYEIKRDFTNFSLKISKGFKRPQEKFVHQMIYGIIAGNKLHLSEIARSLKENITLKKTIDWLSRNLNAFDHKDALMRNYLTLVKRHVKDDYAVIIVDNSDIAEPASAKLEALSKIWDGSTGEISQGYLTIEAAVLSEKGKMPLPVYEKVFQQRKKDSSVKPTRIYAVWNLFPKTLLPNASVPSIVVLMPMATIAISWSAGSVLSSVPKRTGMSFITGRPVISWMWLYGIKGLTAWI